MRNGSTITIDRAGRLVVPKAIREKAGWAPGTRLSVRLREGCVEIEAEPAPVRLERRGSLLVAVHEEGPELTAEEVRNTLERIRRRED